MQGQSCPKDIGIATPLFDTAEVALGPPTQQDHAVRERGLGVEESNGLVGQPYQATRRELNRYAVVTG